MDILVIGGSYFFGRWFVQFASEKHNVTVVNRGNISVNLPGVKELVADRHDGEALKKLLSNQRYDCVVDFCAYEPNDIAGVIDSIGRGFRRYIFISTIDVYERGTGKVIDENSPLEKRVFSGEIGDYIRNKVLLEQELIDSCERAGIEYCSVRPSLLYGPANYAPRESIYFDWIGQRTKIYNPTDASGHFWPLYIKDASLMTLAICEAENIETAYNLCPDKSEDYASWATILHKICDREFTEIPVTISQVINENIPLPFPLTAEESEYYDSGRSNQLGIPYTNLESGLARTFQLYSQSR